MRNIVHRIESVLIRNLKDACLEVLVREDGHIVLSLCGNAVNNEVVRIDVSLCRLHGRAPDASAVAYHRHVLIHELTGKLHLLSVRSLMVECDAAVWMNDMRFEDNVSPALLRDIITKKLEHLVGVSLAELAVSCSVEVKKVECVCASA